MIDPVSRYHGNGEVCRGCGLTYGAFRTGWTYRDVWLLFWHRTEFRNKRRGTVLGKWHQIKREAWADHRAECAPALDRASGEW